MKALNSIKVIAISAVASLILVGCGGSGTSGATTGNSVVGTTISGTAIDPEIQGANVYLDANGNGKYDVGELNTTTDNLGKYSLTIPESDIGKTLIVEGGIDRVTKADFRGRLKMISRATKAEQFATPLTTLVQEYSANDKNKTVSQIKDELATKLGLASADDLDKDTYKNKNLLKIALRIQKVAQKVSDASGKDISSVYKSLANKLSNANFDTAMQDTINADVNSSSIEHSKAVDLDRELKNVDDTSLNSQQLAMTVENIDQNITSTRTKQELSIDIYNKAKIIVNSDKAVKDLQDKKVFDRLGFKDLNDALKQKITANAKIDFTKESIQEIKDKIQNNTLGLGSQDMKEIDREKLFNQAGLNGVPVSLKKTLQSKLDNQNFDFAKASKSDLEKKLKDSTFMSGLSSGDTSVLQSALNSSNTTGSASTTDASSTDTSTTTDNSASGM